MNAYVDGVEVSLAETPGFSYSLFDYLDPSKTKGNTSTTIRIVADARARSVMGSENMQEVLGGRHRLQIGEVGAVYWEGEIVVDAWDREVIECSAVTGNGSWMEGLKAMRLREVDMGDSEIITEGYQRGTWTDESGPLYFPVIDYGFIGEQAPGANIPVARLRPAMRAWWVLRKAFQVLGFSLVARGRWAVLAPKTIMANYDGAIEAAPHEFASRIAIARIPAPELFVRTSGPTGSESFIPQLSVEESDPSGSYNNATYFYSPNVIMALQPVVSLIIRTEALPGNDADGLRIEVINSLGQLVVGTQILPSATSGLISQYTLTEVPLPATSGSNAPLRIRLRAIVGGPGNTIEVEQMRVEWRPISIPYQAGIALQINTCVADWSVADMLKNMQAIFGLKLVTNDATGEVEAWLYDDLLKPTLQGIDWRGREDHSTPPERKRNERPGAYLFRYRHDDKDVELERLLIEAPAPGYGNTDVQIGGPQNPVEIKTDFAPTVSGIVMGELLVPIMRNQSGAQDRHVRIPRILWANGTTGGQWVHSGDTLQQYPNCYFVQAGSALSMAFGPEPLYTEAPGTVAAYAGGFIRRIRESDVLKIRLRLWDDEMEGLDLRRPVNVHDGYGDGWYYIQRINQKTFGKPAYTECDLMQM